jgi:hypothetical protein
MDEDQIRAVERTRIAQALRRYLDDGPGTYRVLLDYLDIEDSDGMREGWLDFNNALAFHGEKIASGERPA